MPLYSYRCDRCNAIAELLRPICERDNATNHSCGGILVKMIDMPQPPVMKLSTKERVTGGLNANKRINPQYAKMAMEGFD